MFVAEPGIYQTGPLQKVKVGIGESGEKAKEQGVLGCSAVDPAPSLYRRPPLRSCDIGLTTPAEGLAISRVKPEDGFQVL
jgi:hypothetical protein